MEYPFPEAGFNLRGGGDLVMKGEIAKDGYKAQYYVLTGSARVVNRITKLQCIAADNVTSVKEPWAKSNTVWSMVWVPQAQVFKLTSDLLVLQSE